MTLPALAWTGATVVVLGGGPSLTVEQVEQVREVHGRVKCIAVNNSFRLAPWSDVLMASDADWHARNPDAAEFAGLRVAVEGNRLDASIHVVPKSILPVQNVTTMPAAGDDRLIAGRNGVHHALNLSVLCGATTVILLGCDGAPRDGRSHWHEGHAGKPIPDDFWSEMQRSFSAQENALAARGVNVLNCSPGSSINSFPKVTLDDALRVFADPVGADLSGGRVSEGIGGIQAAGRPAQGASRRRARSVESIRGESRNRNAV